MTISVFSVFGPNTFPFPAVFLIMELFREIKDKIYLADYYYTIIIFMMYYVNFEINI